MADFRTARIGLAPLILDMRTLTMSTGSDRRSLLTRFFDVFLDEHNIRWMLCIGLMILLGSSLMLVSSSWDSYSVGWRLVVLLGYTGAVHGLGQLTYHSLGLRKTGTGLMALTVLLLPLTFHALRWIHPDGVSGAEVVVDQAVLWGSLAAEFGLCVFAAKRIFKHFLRRTEATFLAAYVLLCLAAAVAPMLPPSLAPLTALVVWSVFAFGSLRVNQHVFWMIEEHRWPRVFGFFPVLLLGTQFLAVFCISLVEHISLQWIGVGVVMTAMPALLAVDALAKTFLRANGKLTRPFPLSISLPLALSMALIATGVGLAATGFPQLHALVPAAAFAAVMLGVVARRTQQRGFVWAMLIALTMAYQFSPTFFRELAMSLVRSTAASIGEQRLPIAFYGLTYLPLLGALSVIAARFARGNETVFAPVMQRFVGAVSVLLLLVAPSHPKALFPVGLSLLVCFLLQLMLFRRRSRQAWAGIALAMATYGLRPFLNDVLGFDCGAIVAVASCAISSAVLALPGRKLDQTTLNWLPESERKHATGWCETLGLLGAVLTAIGWGVVAIGSSATVGVTVTGVALIGLLVVISLLRRDQWVARFTTAFVVLVPTVISIAAGAELLTVITTFSATLGLLWLTLPVLVRKPRSLVTETFANPISLLSSFGLGTMTGLVVWPMAIATFLNDGAEMDLVLLGISLVWTIGSSVLHASRTFATVGWINAMIAVGVLIDALGVAGREWLPCVWTGLSAVYLLTTKTPRPTNDSPIGSAWRDCAAFTLALGATVSLTYLNWPMRLTGCIAALAYILDSLRPRAASDCSAGSLPSMTYLLTRRLAWMALNWHVLFAVIEIVAPEANWTLGLSGQQFGLAAPKIACFAALQAIGWRLAATRQALKLKCHSNNIPADLEDITRGQRALLMIAVFFGLGTTLVSASGPLDALSASLSVITFGVLMLDALAAGVRRASFTVDAVPTAENSDVIYQATQDVRKTAPSFVWLAQAIAAIGCGYLAIGGVITFGSGLSMYALLGCGLVMSAIGHLATRSERLAFASEPLVKTGMLLPAATVVMALLRAFSGAETQWLGFNSLALLGAGAFYFWRGLETRRQTLLCGSAAVLNVALMLLWNELHWDDPQFFMVPIGLSLIGLVELLRNELPERSLNPLRYAGSLVILVSPTFHIVSGSWMHLFSLMVISVTVALLGIGLRLRALLYLGTGFLIADLLAMVIRGGVDNPSVLWSSGIALGMSIVGLAAYCERHREQLLQRMRLMTAELESWR